MLLEYTDTKFIDKEYDCGPAPDFDKTCWFGIKHDLGLEFPNLPYFKDGKYAQKAEIYCKIISNKTLYKRCSTENIFNHNLRCY